MIAAGREFDSNDSDRTIMIERANEPFGNPPWPSAGNTETSGRQNRTTLCCGDYEVRVQGATTDLYDGTVHMTGMPMGLQLHLSPVEMSQMLTEFESVPVDPVPVANLVKSEEITVSTMLDEPMSWTLSWDFASHTLVPFLDPLTIHL